MLVVEPEIDFVVPWVDGNDPVWLDERSHYEKYLFDLVGEVNSNRRYRDWNLMKFWFRGVEKFAPWVRKIHFITWGHLPSFLNTENSKLHIVKHSDFMPSESLPTYSSLAIETCLHRIEGLADRFVYFNDDMFLINKMGKTDFFQNGLPVDFFEENPCYATQGVCLYDYWLHNALNVVNRNFNKYDQIKKNWRIWFKYVSRQSFFNTLRSACWNKYLGFPSSHLPAPFLKQTWFDLWSKESSLLTETMISKFRTPLNIEQDLFRYWQFATGKFSNSILSGRVYHVDEKCLSEICKNIKEQNFNEICLNDDCPNDQFEQCRSSIEQAFELILPEKSSFEK